MRRTRHTRLLAVPVLAALLAAGCSSTAGQSSTAGSAASPPPVALDASGVVARLKAAKLPIGAVTVYTAATDPNHLLGRPNGYVSKSAFTDTRVSPADARDTSAGSVDLGGSVEVFASSADARARKAYIAAVDKSAPIVGTEYDYVSGEVLLRVSQVLTPTQAAAYQKALG
jgi:hypothetical protein